MEPTIIADDRARANDLAVGRMWAAEPVLEDVRPAIEVVPGMTPTTVLASGPPLAPDEYRGGQRRAILYGAVYEGLASTVEEADALVRSGDITIGACHEHGCVGSVAGIYTASMPVFVVRDRTDGNLGFCNFYEGESWRRLNYGVFGDDVRASLDFVASVVAPVVGDAVRRSGGVALKPIVKRALNMGDELHSRNTAATLLFQHALFPWLLDAMADEPDAVRRTVAFMGGGEYFFLRLSMAAAKATADAAHGVPGSSVVTALTVGCTGFAIRVSGLGDEWFRGPLPTPQAKLFEGFTLDDVEWLGGESCITETVGLGGFAQAAAFTLQDYQGGSPEAMVAANLAMYDITVGEHPDYRIPFLGFRGTPTGIDVFEVVRTGVLPVIDAGLAGKDGGQIGAGTLRAPLECFEAAVAAHRATYG